MKVVLLGFGPLPGEGRRVMAPGLRTWHFLNALLNQGHQITVIANRIYGSVPDEPSNLSRDDRAGWTYLSVSDGLWHDRASMRKIVADLHADCAIAVTTPAASVAVDVVGDLPLWGDLYGSIMAEAQTKALIYADDSYLRHFWQQERKALERCDIFSAVSERQQWALIGELGLWGRLNQWTSGYDFATTIPIAAETEPFALPTHKVIRGVLADDSAFVILYSGGYNTWTDIDTLFAALEAIMSRRPEVVFVSTGGKIDGHDDLTFARFQSLVSTSPYRDRIHLRGWVPQDDLPAYYAESNIGVNVDRQSYEALLGSRTRVLDWMRSELPAIMSSLTELSAQIRTEQAGLTYRPGDVADLVRCFEQVAVDRAATRQMGIRARQLLCKCFTYSATTDRLRAWVAMPSHAPDYAKHTPQLARDAHGPIVAIRQIVATRSLDLGLALRLWPTVVRIMNMLGLGWLQTRLIKIGMRALRLDRPPYAVQYIDYHLPEQWQTSGQYTIPVVLRNTGRNGWPSAESDVHSVSLSYHWLKPDGTMVIRDGVRTPLTTLLKPGHVLNRSMVIDAPEVAGSYRLEIDLVHEGVTWFHDAGAPNVQADVEILDAADVSH